MVMRTAEDYRVEFKLIRVLMRLGVGKDGMQNAFYRRYVRDGDAPEFISYSESFYGG